MSEVRYQSQLIPDSHYIQNSFQPYERAKFRVKSIDMKQSRETKVKKRRTFPDSARTEAERFRRKKLPKGQRDDRKVTVSLFPKAQLDDKIINKIIMINVYKNLSILDRKSPKAQKRTESPKRLPSKASVVKAVFQTRQLTRDLKQDQKCDLCNQRSCKCEESTDQLLMEMEERQSQTRTRSVIIKQEISQLDQDIRNTCVEMKLNKKRSQDIVKRRSRVRRIDQRRAHSQELSHGLGRRSFTPGYHIDASVRVRRPYSTMDGSPRRSGNLRSLLNSSHAKYRPQNIDMQSIKIV